MTQYNPQLINNMLQILNQIATKAEVLKILASKLAVITPVLKYGLLGAYTTKFVQEVRSSHLKDLLRKEAELKKLITAQQLSEAMVLPYATTQIRYMFKFVEEFIRQNLKVWCKIITDHPKVSFVYAAGAIYIYRKDIISILSELITYLKKYFKK
jgi:hypothetical protein